MIPNVRPILKPHARFYFDAELEREIGSDYEIIPVTVGYNVSRFYPATRYEPASGGEIEIVSVDRNNVSIDITDEEEKYLIELASEDANEALEAEAEAESDYRRELRAGL